MGATNEQLARIRNNLTDYFSVTELQSLAFDLGIDYERLDSTNKEGKARSLIEYLVNRQRLHQLAAHGSRLRPKLDWSFDDLPIAANNISQSSLSRSKVFVTYCHEDVDKDVLDYLKHLLDENAQDNYEILLDKDLKYGDDLAAFMAMLRDVDAVIILMSPAYKRKVQERRGGVYDEYTIISVRYSEIRSQILAGKKTGEIEGYFELVPILISGDHQTSVLDEMASLKYLNLVGFRVSRNNRGEIVTTDYTRTKFIPEIQKISDRLQVISTLKGPDFENLYNEYYSKLFLDLKADWNESHDSLPSLLVKTRVYRKIEHQSVYFIIGRKGSGKSTVTDALAIRQRQKYKDHIAIVADNYDLEFAFSLFNLDQVLSDTSTVVSRVKVFQFIWETVFHLRCMEVLLSLDKKDDLNSYQKQFIKPIEERLNEIIENRDVLSKGEMEQAYFAYAFSTAVEFVKDCIQGARNDPKLFYADIKARFNRQRMLEFAISVNALNAFENIIATCRRKFLLTLDGFDTSFDSFRRNGIYRTSDLQKRTAFEIDWLRSLLLLVIDVKQRNQDIRLHQLMDFCITIPRDRFFELLKTERDSYRYHNRYCFLDWSGIELAILLRKRLEELSQTSTDRQKKPVERMEWVLKQKFGHIPWQITFDYNGGVYQMPLFLYVLRHTFWRPRDVLLYYAKIISSCEDLRRKGLKVTSETIRRAVKETTYEVINSEFLNEFNAILLNLSEIVNLFARSTQFLNYQQVGSILAKIDFKFASSKMRVKNTDAKIEFLYQIGFFGIHATSDIQARYNVRNRHAFYFNEGSALLRTAGESRFKEFEFIVHPVFFEYLQLDTGKRELVMNLDWEYLSEMETLLSVGSQG